MTSTPLYYYLLFALLLRFSPLYASFPYLSRSLIVLLSLLVSPFQFFFSTLTFRLLIFSALFPQLLLSSPLSFFYFLIPSTPPSLPLFLVLLSLLSTFTLTLVLSQFRILLPLLSIFLRSYLPRFFLSSLSSTGKRSCSPAVLSVTPPSLLLS